MNTKKIQYHHRAKQSSIDKNNPQVLTSSPIEQKLQEKNFTPFFLNKISDEDQEQIDENISLRHTVQSINEKDDVNYLSDSHALNKDLYLTTKNNKKEQPIDFSILDTDEHYIRASENLLSKIKGALEFFNTKDIKTKNREKIPTIIIYKEDYDKLRHDYENVVKENLKLKEKNKQLKENSSRSNSNMENFNLSKFLDSLTYMQTKNQELETENKKLKTENEELLQKLKYVKKMYSEDKHSCVIPNKNNNSRSHVSVRATNKNKNEIMEELLKQQIKCMKKMIGLVQEGKDSLEDSDASKQKIDLNEEKSESEIHFEESFNVMNLSNSIDYNMDDNHMKPLEKKHYESKSNKYNQSVPKNHKYEIFLKPFEKKYEKMDKKLENAVDDLQVIPNSKSMVTGAKTNTQPGKEYNTIYLNKESNKSKILTSVQFNDKPIKKLGGRILK